MKSTIAFIILFCLSVLSAQKPDEFTLTETGQTAPDFTVTTLDGHKITLSQLRGKVVLLNFFATWCGPCMAEMPELQKQIYQAFKDKGLVVLALGREHTPAELITFREKKGFTFPMVADEGRAVFKLFATQNIPRNVVIDKQGKIVLQEVGFSGEKFEQLINTIKNLLKQ